MHPALAIVLLIVILYAALRAQARHKEWVLEMIDADIRSGQLLVSSSEFIESGAKDGYYSGHFVGSIVGCPEVLIIRADYLDLWRTRPYRLTVYQGDKKLEWVTRDCRTLRGPAAEFAAALDRRLDWDKSRVVLRAQLHL
jgi:hypothetical protein